MSSMIERSSSVSFDPTCPNSEHVVNSFVAMLFLFSSSMVSEVVLVFAPGADIADCSARSTTLERDDREAGEKKPVKPLTSAVWAARDRRMIKNEEALVDTIMKYYQ